MQLSRTTLIVFGIRVLSMVVQAGGLVFFAHQLGAHRLGVFVLLQAIVVFLSFVADLGLDDALEKRVSEGTEGHVIGSAIFLKACIVLIVLVGIIAASGPLNRYMGQPLAAFLVPLLLLRQGATIFVTVLRGELRVGEAAVVKFLQRVTFVSVGAFLVLGGHGVEGLVYGMMVGWLATGILAALRIDSRIERPTMDTISSLVDFSKYNVIVSVIGGYTYNWMDTLLIGVFMSQSHVAAYEIAWRIVGIVMLLSESIGQTIFPQISNWDIKGQRSKIVKTIPSAVTGTMIFVGPAIIGIALFGPEILRYVFGSDFVIASTALLILMVSKIPEGVNTVLGRVLLGLDRPDLAARAVGAFIVLNLVLNLLLINLYGIDGAALATAISFAVNMGISAYYLNRLLDVQLPGADLFTMFLAAMGMGAILAGSDSIWPVNSLPGVLWTVLLGGIVYFGFLLLSPSFRQRFQQIARRMI